MDRERRYFNATAGSFEHGTPYTRCRSRQVSDEPNAPPEKVNLVIGQPQIAEFYYSTCSAIDKHNRLRQDDLRIEKKVETINWSTWVNLSIFAMIVVDAWLVYNAFAQRGRGEELRQSSLQVHPLIFSTRGLHEGSRKWKSKSGCAYSCDPYQTLQEQLSWWADNIKVSRPLQSVLEEDHLAVQWLRGQRKISVSVSHKKWKTVLCWAHFL